MHTHYYSISILVLYFTCCIACIPVIIMLSISSPIKLLNITDFDAVYSAHAILYVR
jgi:hypothetical protein